MAAWRASIRRQRIWHAPSRPDRRESSVAARQAGSAHPAQNAMYISSSSIELLDRLASTRVQTMIRGDHPGAGLWLLIAAVCVIVVLSYVWLGS